MSQKTTDRASRIVRGPFKGKYGDWYLTQADVDDVRFYRGALLLNATVLAFGVTCGFVGLAEGLLLEMITYAHLVSLCVAFLFVPINTEPIHKELIIATFTVLFLLAFLLVPNSIPIDEAMVVTVLSSRKLMVIGGGYQFLFLTGIFYVNAKRSRGIGAVILFGLFFVLCVGHFLDVLNTRVKVVGLVLFAVIYLVFALRKILDKPEIDVGDKSITDHFES